MIVSVYWWRAHRSDPFPHTSGGCTTQPSAAPGSYLQKHEFLYTSASPQVITEPGFSPFSCSLESHHRVLMWEIWWARECSSPPHPGIQHLTLVWEQQDIFQADFTKCLQVLPSTKNVLRHLQTHLSLNSVGLSTGSLQCSSLNPLRLQFCFSHIHCHHPRDTKTCSKHHQPKTGPNWLLRNHQTNLNTNEQQISADAYIKGTKKLKEEANLKKKFKNQSLD